MIKKVRIIFDYKPEKEFLFELKKRLINRLETKNIHFFPQKKRLGTTIHIDYESEPLPSKRLTDEEDIRLLIDRLEFDMSEPDDED